jgi:hypothetical protein
MPQNEKPNAAAVVLTNAVWCGLVFTVQNYESRRELSKVIFNGWLNRQDVNGCEEMLVREQSGLKPFVDLGFLPRAKARGYSIVGMGRRQLCLNVNSAQLHQKRVKNNPGLWSGVQVPVNKAF